MTVTTGSRRRVHVHGLDPLSTAGLIAQVRASDRLELVDLGEKADGDSVAVAAVETLNEPAVRMIRKARTHGCRRVVLVVASPDRLDLLRAIELGVCAILPRSLASTPRLTSAVLQAAAGEAAMPADLLGRLVDSIARLQGEVLAPRGLSASGMAEREIRILRLMAEGKDTREIANELNYSERTVKNVLHDVTSRFHLRNRSHAVAYAVRAGLI